MKIINVCYDDYANYMHGITKSLQAAGAACREFKMKKHPFGYAEEAPVCRIEDMIVPMQEADIINIFHTSTIFIPVIKNLYTKPMVTVWHTGTKYRQSPKEMNAAFAEISATVFTDQCEFFALPGFRGNYIAAALEMDDTKRCSRIPYRFAHYPSNKHGEDTKGTQVIKKYMQGHEGRATWLLDDNKVSHKEQLQRMAKCDIYIELFAPEQEGKPYGCYGVTAFEAAAMGKIVVTQNTMPQVYRSAYGVDTPFELPNTEKALGETIGKLCMLHHKDIAYLQEKHRQWMLKHHSYKATGNILLKRLSAL